MPSRSTFKLDDEVQLVSHPPIKMTNDYLTRTTSLRNLHRTRIYGDYLIFFPQTHSLHASKSAQLKTTQTADPSAFPPHKTWLQIHETQLQEKKSYETWTQTDSFGLNDKLPPRPTDTAIYMTARKINITSKTAEYSIHWAANQETSGKKEIPWNGTTHHFHHRNWRNLGDQLLQDINDLPALFNMVKPGTTSLNRELPIQINAWSFSELKLLLQTLYSVQARIFAVLTSTECIITLPLAEVLCASDIETRQEEEIEASKQDVMEVEMMTAQIDDAMSLDEWELV